MPPNNKKNTTATGEEFVPVFGDAATPIENPGVVNDIKGLQDTIVPFSQTPEGKASLDKLRNFDFTLNESDFNVINAAGLEAQQQFQPLLIDAQEQRRKGLPKALIGAGERGGLMNTQFAGTAALNPIAGGDFFGGGGKLKEISNQFDANIQKIRGQQLLAISRAKQAAKSALLTGKRSDLNFLKGMVDTLRQNQQDFNDLQESKISALQGVEDRERLDKEGLDIKNRRKVELEQDLALKGFRKVAGPSGLAGLTEEDIVRVPNEFGGVDIYERPKDEVIATGGVGQAPNGIITSDVKPSVEKIQSFEDFISEKENEVLQSFTPEKREELRDEYDSLQIENEAVQGNTDGALKQTLSNKILGMNLAKNVREFTFKEFNDRLAQGDVKGAKDVVDKLGRPLNQTIITTLADSANAIPSLDRLETSMNNLINKFGVVKGIISKYNKFDVDAQTAQAQINLVKQMVGKGLEGGVLRKEDEEKYKKILAQLDDNPQVALNKLKILKREISSKLQIQMDFLSSSGFSVGGVRDEVDKILNSSQVKNQSVDSVGSTASDILSEFGIK